MKQATLGGHWLAAALLLAVLLLQQTHADAMAANTNTNNTDTKSEPQKIVKKAQPLPPENPPAQADTVQQPPAVPAIPEKEKASEKTQPKQLKVQPKAMKEHEIQPANMPQEDVRIEHTKRNNDEDLPETFTAVFYVLVGITTSAILLLIVRVYRLRLSRAERKYGVQGDRANQELTPLPMAIEDVNSDEEEDHTLFEVNRHSIRIL